MKRYLVILNPTAASGNAGRMAPKIVEEFKAQGVNYEMVSPNDPGMGLSWQAKPSNMDLTWSLQQAVMAPLMR